MGGVDVDIGQAQIIGKIEAEVHTLNTLVKTLFTKFDSYVEKSQPRPMSISAYVGLAVSILGIFALLFGSVMYISNSSNAPLVAQISQMTQVLATIQNNTMQNANQNQILVKEVSGIEKSVDSNEATLEWLLFSENLPKQVTEVQGRVNTLEMQVTRIVNEIHSKGK